MIRSAFILSLLAGGILTAMLLASDDSGVAVAVAWGVLITGFSGFMMFHADEKFDPFSPGVLTNVTFVTANGLHLILTPLDSLGPLTEYLERFEVFYPTVGAVVFWTSFNFNLAYVIISKTLKPVRPRPNTVPRIDDQAMLGTMWWIFFILGVFSQASFIFAGGIEGRNIHKDYDIVIFSSSLFFGGAIFIALSISALRVLSTNFKDTKELFKLSICLFIIILLSILHASKTILILPIIIAAMSYNYHRKLLNKKQLTLGIAVLFLIFLVVFPVNLLQREKLSDPTRSTGQEITHSLDSFGESVEMVTELDAGRFLSMSLDHIAGRFNQNFAVAGFMRHFDGGGETQNGGTYASALFGLIPRFLWPDKPAVTLGRDVAINVFGYASSNATNIGATLTGEAVYNFGVVLAPLIGLIFGALFQVVYFVFKNFYFQMPTITTIFYIHIWINFLFPIQGGDFGGPASGIFKWLVIFLAIRAVLQLGGTRVRAHPS